MLYLPETFAERDLATLHAFIERYGFATLLTPDALDPPVTHLPLLLDRTRGPQGVLLGHMARANPHWQAIAAQPQVLALFHGPHAYVSPSWYQSHPSVPTWNYAVVHVRGRARLLHDPQQLEPLVRTLVERHEQSRPHPWTMALPAEFQAQMLAAIVGFEIEIAHLEGKLKLSQNRPAKDRQNVLDALSAGTPGEREVAALMRQRQS